MTLIMFINGVSRYALGTTFIWAEEVIRLLFVWAMFIGITDLFTSGGHIGFDAIINKNSMTRKVCGILSNLVLIFIGEQLAVHGYGIISVIGKIPLAATKLPNLSFQLPGVLAGVAWIIIGIWNIVKILKTKEEKGEEQ